MEDTTVVTAELHLRLLKESNVDPDHITYFEKRIEEFKARDKKIAEFKIALQNLK